MSDKETKDAVKALTQAGMIRYILFGSLALTHVGVFEARKLGEDAATRSSAGARGATVTSDHKPVMENELTRLLQFIVDHYNLDELRTLCFRLGVNYDNLGSETLKGKARELILLTLRQDKLDTVLLDLKQDHPEAFEKAGLGAPYTTLPEHLPRG